MPTHPLEKREFRRGPGGRPTREEAERRHKALIDSAIRLFLDGGLAGTSIEAIAESAGVAKRFIYARYASKEELFLAAIARLAEERLVPLAGQELPELPVEQGLYEFGRRLLAVALGPEPLSIYRIFVTEGRRFPSLAQLFLQRNRERVLGGFRRILSLYAERGELEIDDLQMTAEHFFILIVGIPQRFALIGVREEPAEADRRLKSAIRLFLEGCRAKKAGPGPVRGGRGARPRSRR